MTEPLSDERLAEIDAWLEMKLTDNPRPSAPVVVSSELRAEVDRLKALTNPATDRAPAATGPMSDARLAELTERNATIGLDTQEARDLIDEIKRLRRAIADDWETYDDPWDDGS